MERLNIPLSKINLQDNSHWVLFFHLHSKSCSTSMGQQKQKRRDKFRLIHIAQMNDLWGLFFMWPKGC